MLRKLGLCVLWLTACCAAADYGKVTRHKVADGVYLFTTTPYADVGFCGNSVAIITSDGVLVFDTGATPETAQTILAEIRKLTDKPVRYLVNSHWHWDHWGGNQVFLEANPALQIISHEKNLEMMATVEPPPSFRSNLLFPPSRPSFFWSTWTLPPGVADSGVTTVRPLSE